MGIVSMFYCVTRFEMSLMAFDKHYFGTEGLDMAAGVMMGFNMLGGAVGAITAQFLSTQHAVIFTLVLSCVQVVSLCFITERWNLRRALSLLPTPGPKSVQTPYQ